MNEWMNREKKDGLKKGNKELHYTAHSALLFSTLFYLHCTALLFIYLFSPPLSLPLPLSLPPSLPLSLPPPPPPPFLTLSLSPQNTVVWKCFNISLACYVHQKKRPRGVQEWINWKRERMEDWSAEKTRDLNIAHFSTQTKIQNKDVLTSFPCSPDSPLVPGSPGGPYDLTTMLFPWQRSE